MSLNPAELQEMPFQTPIERLFYETLFLDRQNSISGSLFKHPIS
jgi:hypothetical protein